MYAHAKEKLKEAGELMVKISDGQTFELHLHNTIFHDSDEVIELDASTETYWINGSEIVYTWIHRVKE